MSTTVYPGTTTKISCTDAPTGLTGTLKWQLKQDTTVIQARNATGVEEDPAGSGIYLIEVTWPTTTGRYRFIADTGTITPDTVLEEEIIVSYSRVDVPASDGPAYTHIPSRGSISNVQSMSAVSAPVKFSVTLELENISMAETIRFVPMLCYLVT